jgi:hypothetical protein
MSNPTIYVQSFDFSDFASAQPTTPLPGLQVDVQLSDIAASLISMRDCIVDVRRADGALVNGIVTYDSLATDLLDQLLALSMATDAAASAAAAAASAAAADVDADRAEVAADTLASVAATLAAGGGYADWGDWHSAPGTTLDWGTWH